MRQPVGAFEVVVEYQDVSALLTHLSRQLWRVWCCAHDQQIWLVLNESAQPGEYGGMVVEECHVDHARESAERRRS